MKLSMFALILFFSFFQVQSGLCLLDCDWSKAVSSVEAEKPSPCHEAETQNTHNNKDSNHCFDTVVCNSGHYVSKQASFDYKSQETSKLSKNLLVVNPPTLLPIFITKNNLQNFKLPPHWSLKVQTLKHTIKTHSFII